MNYSMAIFLINKNARAVLATYESDENARRTAFKTLDDTIAEGDYVIVSTETRHGMTVVKVVEVDVDLDFDSSTPVEWVIGRVERADYEQLLKDEQVAIRAIKSAELRKKREDLRKTMFADHIETLTALPIVVINGNEQTEQK